MVTCIKSVFDEQIIWNSVYSLPKHHYYLIILLNDNIFNNNTALLLLDHLKNLLALCEASAG